ncbi:MAG: serine hydrolase, partial [Myxococcales bacterium]|nr:serine hydrolase [Myxococcales bacterium]
ARAGTLLPHDATTMNPSWGWAAGAAISTAPELGRYARALATGELLGPAMHEQRLASVTPNEPSNPETALYGLGIGKLGPMFGHTGELPGFNTFMGHDPVQDVTLIVWTPLDAAPDGKPPAIEIAKIVLGELYAGGAR